MEIYLRQDENSVGGVMGIQAMMNGFPNKNGSAFPPWCDS